jgi:uncharacterized protein (DUF1697 family)
VVFDARAATERSLERKAEAAMEARLGRSFFPIARPVDALGAMLESEPFAGFRLAPGAKRVVTFLRDAPRSRPALPVELEGARILAMSKGGREAFTAYVRHPSGPVFMTLIEKTFGRDVTTRTWDTIDKVRSH